MTWEQIESNWKQLKSGLKASAAELPDDERASVGTIGSNAAGATTVQSELVTYKRSLHHGRAYIRRRQPGNTQPAGWTPGR